MSAERSIRDHVIVDGSNIATEGRTLPSLAQLDEAVRAFLEEFPATRITVIVDATFQHRIDASEVPAYEAAVLAGEMVAPPAGAIGRGDAFIVAVADKADATVFSNDSFQELHADYGWLFDTGRLIGGKPVDGVGWVFVPRNPVRGQVSRRVSSRGKKNIEKTSDAESVAAEVAARRAGGQTSTKSTGTTSGRGTTDGPGTSSGRGRRSSVSKAADDRTSTERTKNASKTSKPRPRRGGSPDAAPVNTPDNFLSFLTQYQIGAEVTATIDRFSSHGAYAMVGAAHCYVPLRLLSDPPPRRARDALTLGESKVFVVDALDAPRRSIDLALPGQPGTGTSVRDLEPAQEAIVMAVKKKAPAKKAPAKKAPAKKAPAKKAPAKKAPAKKAPAKKAPAKKAPAKKAPAKKAPAKKAPAKKAPAKKAPAKKAPAKKAPAKKAPAKKAPAKKAPAKKAPAKKAPAKKAPAKKAPARRR